MPSVSEGYGVLVAIGPRLALRAAIDLLDDLFRESAIAPPPTHRDDSTQAQTVIEKRITLRASPERRSGS